jgi:hypothetical protein
MPRPRSPALPLHSPEQYAPATCSIFREWIGRAADGKVPDGIEAQTRAAMDDIGATLKTAGLGYGDVFHCTVFLTDMKN